MEPLSLLVVGLLSLAALANPVARDGMVMLQSIKSAPDSFEYVGPASPSATVSLRLQLTQGNMTGLEQELYAVSTPGSGRYGKYLSREQVRAYFIDYSSARSTNVCVAGRGACSTGRGDHLTG